MPLVAAPQLEMMVLIWAKLRALPSLYGGLTDLTVSPFYAIMLAEQIWTPIQS